VSLKKSMIEEVHLARSSIELKIQSEANRSPWHQEFGVWCRDKGHGGGSLFGTGGGTGAQCEDVGEGKCTATPASVHACNGCKMKQNTNVMTYNHTREKDGRHRLFQ